MEFINKLSEKAKTYDIILTAFILTIIGLVFFPLFFRNNMNTWDLSGHIFSIQYIREYLFPAASGWNPFFSLGYPQGSFYPGLVHYIISLMTFVYNDPIFWLKFFIILTIALIPITIRIFVKEFSKYLELNLANKHIVIITIFSSIIIFISPSYYPGSLNSALLTGLVTNFFILPLFFLYVAYLLKTFTFVEVNFKQIIIPVLLLSFIMLSHLVLGLISVLITITLFLSKQFEFKKINVFNNQYTFILAIAFIPTSFFFVPYILNNYLISPILANVFFGKDILLISSGIAMINVIITTKFIEKKTRSIAFIVIPVLVIAISTLETFLYDYASIDIEFGLLQPYRLFSISLFILIPITFVLLAIGFNKLSKNDFVSKILGLLKNDKFSLGISIFLIFVSIVGLVKLVPYTRNERYVELDSGVLNTMSGNYLVLVTEKETPSLYREVFYAPVNQNKNLFSLNTQFNESSYTNASIEALARNLYNNLINEDIDYPETYILSDNKIKFLLKLYNTKYLIFSDINKVKTNYCQNVLRIGRIVQANIVDLYSCEVSKYPISDIKLKQVDNKNWDNEMEKNLHAEENELLVSRDLSPEKIKLYNEKIRWSDNFQVFTVNLEKGFNIIPVQYNNHWKAFKDSKQIEIIRVSPNLIGIYGSGEVRFEYNQ
jgi:hypothetical protein